MYANDNKGFVPPRYRGYAKPLKTGVDVTSTFGPNWLHRAARPAPSANGPALVGRRAPGNARQAYLKTNDVFFCPTDTVRAPFRERCTGGVRRLRSFRRGFGSLSYWHWYFPKKYWSSSTGAPAVSPADYINTVPA